MVEVSESLRNEWLNTLYAVRRTVVKQHRLMGLDSELRYVEVKETEDAVELIDRIIAALVLGNKDAVIYGGWGSMKANQPAAEQDGGGKPD